MSKSEQRRIDILSKAEIDEARDNFIQDCGLTLKTSSADVMAQAWDACALFMQSKMSSEVQGLLDALRAVLGHHALFIHNDGDELPKHILKCEQALGQFSIKHKELKCES